MDNFADSGDGTAKTWRNDEPLANGAVPGAALISKAFRLIDTIGAAPGLITVPELVKATGWPRPTLYRILAAITAHGFVRFDPVAQGYTLGYRFLELAQNVWAAPDLARLIHGDRFEVSCASLAGGSDQISGMSSSPSFLLGG
jgi:hypothetical protein